MKEKKKNIIPKNFFNVPRKIITSKEALKDVIPVNWNDISKSRKNEKNQIVKLVKKQNNIT